MTDPIDRLIEADRTSPKRVCVVGDSMLDLYVHGSLTGCQDGCPKFVERQAWRVPGGAAGAARQLANWNADVSLVSVIGAKSDGLWQGPLRGLNTSFAVGAMPVKRRYLVDDKIVYRVDDETQAYFANKAEAESVRTKALGIIKDGDFDAVLLSDYEKGFLTEQLIRGVIEHCNRKQIPVVADAKRVPNVYRGAVVKCNEDYSRRHGFPDDGVVTFGSAPPLLRHNGDSTGFLKRSNPPLVPYRNHVGAGDCFAAHLTLALAHGFTLEDAAAVAHSAGRVYVQHLHNRPPHPLEVRKDLDPVGGKIVGAGHAAALRRSVTGRLVFANGRFRIGAHAGHAWMLDWARRQGDVLVVGINDDASLAASGCGRYLPLGERAGTLTGLAAVDWVCPYSGATPEAVLTELKADVLVKGADNRDKGVPPGGYLVRDVLFAPESPFPKHSTDLVRDFR